MRRLWRSRRWSESPKRRRRPNLSGRDARAGGHAASWAETRAERLFRGKDRGDAMHSRYVERDAEAIVARYAGGGVLRDIALRVYTTRLLGQDPKLVRHGGGNTSVKTRLTDLVGAEVEALCVKGSGFDMAAI